MLQTTENNNYPQRVYLASSSPRKTFGFGRYVTDRPNPKIVEKFQHKGLDLTTQNPSEFHEKLEQQIPNRDNELPEDSEIELGELAALTFVGKSQRGENPVTETAEVEALNKINDVARHLQGQDVLIFSSDTIGENSNSSEKLGKPLKHPEFPHNASEIEIQQFRKWYMETYYKPGTEVSHVHAFAMLNVLNGEQFQVTTRLTQIIPKNITEIATRFYDQSGGAGIWQQLINWNGKILDSITSPLMKKYFAEMSAQRQKELFYLHLIGIPSWQIMPALNALTVENKSNK